MKLVSARLAAESAKLTGNPTREYIELAMMANVEFQDEYEAVQVGRYQPNPAPPPDQRAITWMGAWRVLRRSLKYSGAAAAAAHAARRGRTLREEADGLSEDEDNTGGDDVWEVDSDAGGTVRGLRKLRAASFTARPQRVRSVRAAEAAKVALRCEGRQTTKAMGDTAKAQSDRALTALMSCPALRDEPRFKTFLTQRADEIIAARNAARDGPSGSAASASASAGVGGGAG